MTNTLKAPQQKPERPATGASPLLRFYRSSIGKKLITGFTGLALVTFVLVHMAGNLLLFVGRDAYNAYALLVSNFHVVYYAFELALTAIVVLHAWVGIEIFWRRRQARPEGYSTYQSAGGNSYQTLSSRTMIVTGSVLAVFWVTHLMTFRFGTHYTTELGGDTVRDLARLVIEKFQTLPYVLGYTVILVLLASHLRHGFWSALQSMGLLDRGIRPLAYGTSAVVGVGIAAGFLLLPWAIYLGWVS
ncbi:succinate dehydrogenase cytochrome b subunit [Phormidium tenue]|uniref:Succinate dehydrogenase n=1 Tax=Phormidium tenue NIES-30 TaxID=549789 RepID=A0A1U7J1G9_9CYAN|nr:succinate dehydrogenase cytochrome b subunit [Phormidium tenue]MBD2232231.1 succinate dehydrogenase cytochrome b subunit [Phormidium tenue FACHB-1052]OKH45830.1 succinate dehydrogenase [Phormidium tenue NIES-30]